ncbi:fasciclin domain-containing protein [Rhodohalobacter sp.]|uniref:fasciclin domain-containing protein n=1 Tax=Rhodohalobacter sp. TaxID=1974210 RepID=UPI002ACE8B06|nr:fasciclin domain-containing protein [Rhodohalobacter sp.]MDZ7757589.1 fasciclin domain-containing protein [Rhodohalobacter sp.]
MKINNTIRKLLLFIIAPLLTITFITACGDDGDGPTPPPAEELNLVELAQSDEDFSTLVSVIEDLGLEETLTSGDFTVFAPTNAAFNALPDGVLESLTDEQLLDIIQFHVTEGSVPSSALGATQDVPMLNEENTLVQSSAAGVVVNGSSNVVKADLEATNGYIHGIDEVLLPSAIRIALGQPNLVDVAQEDGRFETLIGLVEDTGLTTTLQYLGPYTAFAPTDDAFTALFEEVDPGTLTTEQLTFILTYHVISGEGIASGDLAEEQAVASAAEELLYITSNEENGVTVNGNSSVIDADVDASNGIIHVVDNVLLPNAFLNTVQVAQKNYNFTTLVDLIVQANLAETVATTELTVFAPTNAAFEALFAEVDPGSLTPEQLEEILLYHTIPGATIASGDLQAQQNPASTTGEALYVTVDGDVVVNGNSTVVTADVASNNGIIHAVDTVLLPNAFVDVPAIAQKNYDLTTLVGLLVDNDLVGTLQGDGPFTVFAPTNAAFEAISDVVSTLTPEQVVEVLTYHVLAANVESGDIVPPQTVTMLNEQDITIDVVNDVVTITDAAGGTAEVVVADQVGTNGVVHIIDAVLIPDLGDGNGGGDQAVTLPVTFEDENVDYALTDFGGNISEIVADPTDGTNTVAQSTKGAGSEVWAGTTIGGTVGFENPIPFTETETTMSVRVWSPTAGTPIRLKVEDATDGGISVETEVNTTVAQQWETLVFDFSNEVTGAPLNLSNVYDKASIFFNFGTSGSDEVYYWDDVEFGGEATGGGGNGGGEVAEPTAAAPAPPTRDAANVISVFSDAYTDIGVTTFATTWSEGSLVGDVEIVSGDFIKLYDIGNFIGIQLDSGIDLTSFTHMHFDFWVADESVGAGAVFNPKLSNHAGLPGSDGETSAIVATNPVTEAGQWVSFDVPLDDFTDAFGGGVLDRDKIYQIVMTTSGTINNVYIDNLYFYKE